MCGADRCSIQCTATTSRPGKPDTLKYSVKSFAGRRISASSNKTSTRIRVAATARGRKKRKCSDHKPELDGCAWFRREPRRDGNWLLSQILRERSGGRSIVDCAV